MSKRTIMNTATGLSVLLALIFAGAGTSKIIGVAQTVQPFEVMGLPAMAPIVGLLEIAGAIALFIPRLRLLAILGLSATMVGAVAYHLILDPERNALPGIILLALSLILVWMRLPSAKTTSNSTERKETLR